MTVVVNGDKKPTLFRSNIWLSSWWKHWGGHPSYLASDKCEELLDISFVTYCERKFSVLDIVTLIPVGVTSSVAKSIRAEYFGYNDPSRFIRFLMGALTSRWDQLIIPDAINGTQERTILREFSAEHNFALVIKEKSIAYGVDVRTASFEDYLKALGKNTRLKLFNRRTKLAEKGSVTLENIWPNIDEFMILLNNYHVQRWSKPCFAERNLALIVDVLLGVEKAGGKVDLSVLKVDGEPVSVVLDVLLQGRIYNFQAGFIENFVPGISLGTLHLGYQIEAAFLNDSIDYYDFMAGEGKNANYKQNIANASVELVTICLVRSKLLKIAYWLKFKLRHYRKKFS